MTNATIPQIGVAEISDIIVGVIVGLVIGGFWSFVSWYKRRKELGVKLYYPLWLACCNLLLVFDKINIYKDDEAGGKELYKSAVRPLNDIMYAYGTAVHLKGKIKKTEEDYLSMFFIVRRTIDLNQKFVNSEWAKAVIGFKNAREQYYTGNGFLKKKIEEFKDLYTDLKNLKEFCERKRLSHK